MWQRGFNPHNDPTFRDEELVSLLHDRRVHDGVKEGRVFLSLLIGDGLFHIDIGHVIIVKSHQGLNGGASKRINREAAKQPAISDPWNQLDTFPDWDSVDWITGAERGRFYLRTTSGSASWGRCLGHRWCRRQITCAIARPVLRRWHPVWLRSNDHLYKPSGESQLRIYLYRRRCNRCSNPCIWCRWDCTGSRRPDPLHVDRNDPRRNPENPPLESNRPNQSNRIINHQKEFNLHSARNADGMEAANVPLRRNTAKMTTDFNMSISASCWRASEWASVARDQFSVYPPSP